MVVGEELHPSPIFMHPHQNLWVGLQRITDLKLYFQRFCLISIRLGSAELAHRWHLPDELVCCILFHHHGLKILAHPQLRRSAVAVVALSALLPDQLQQHYHGLDDLVRLEEK